jgi:DNA helicase-2/ATP-dependent DNA helicase PcrA
MEQGLFPLKSSEVSPDELEEERRLFYVAITRAMERLFLTHSYKRMRFGDFVHLPKSQFVDEIKAECIKQREIKITPKPEINAKPAVSRESYSQISGYQDNYSQIEESEWDFRVGDVVRHNSFGKGRITGMSGSGDKRQAVVYFPSVGGKKQLMLKYAKLEKVKPERS